MLSLQHRTHTCGELQISHVQQTVTLCGWVQRIRDKGSVIWIDLRDRYGITQLIFDQSVQGAEILEKARQLGREYVVKATGKVIERIAKNPQLPTGDIEVQVQTLELLNAAKTPPFLIEDETDGGDDLRMKYRYLDLRRPVVRKNFELRHKAAQATRQYLSNLNFLEVETPVLIKSTPEGARDFVVPSRLNQGEFYALPQSPQTFKQLLMVSGFDRYFQIVKCFRDEDLRADRQPEFTQIDCEMAFVTQEDILQTFEGLIRHLFKAVLNVELPEYQRMTFDDAMKYYGNDKPDLRFDMKITEITNLAKGKGFQVFDAAEMVAGICAKGCANYTRKQLDELTAWLKRPQIGAKGLVWVKCNEDGTFSTTVSKFFTDEDLKQWANAFNAKAGDLLLLVSDETNKTRKILSELRLEMGERLGLRPRDKFVPLWVLDFPLVEFDKEANRWNAMHHPFTSPKPEDIAKLMSDTAAVRANAYDMVINGVEVGGGSVRIHDRGLQEKIFELLGMTAEEARAKFGFLMDAFEYGAPPHGGIAFGFDRLCAMMGGENSIRDFIAFPKNNSGRDTMIDAPSALDEAQLQELKLKIVGAKS
jgi:aspartyl-tRNA synthetase